MMHHIDPKLASSFVSLKEFGQGHAFHFRYMELCRINKIPPQPEMRLKNSSVTVLNFHGDKLSVTEWQIFVNALSNDKTLESFTIRMRRVVSDIDYGIDTESKLKRYRDGPVLFTKFVYCDVMEAIINFLQNNTKLKLLALEGFPLKRIFVGSLANAISKCENLKELSFSRSKLENNSCETICNALKYMNNIQKINFSSCDITEVGAKTFADLIKIRKISGCMSTWQESLRYSQNTSKPVACLYFINLSDNILMGDNGAKLIIEALMEDYFVKEVVMENCNLTDISARALIKCLEINKTIMEFNLKRNLKISKKLYLTIRSYLGNRIQKGVKVDDIKAIEVHAEVPKNDSVPMLKQELKVMQEKLTVERNLRKKTEDNYVGMQSKLEKDRQKIVDQKSKNYAAASASAATAPPALEALPEKKPVPIRKKQEKLASKWEAQSAGDDTSPAFKPGEGVGAGNSNIFSSASSEASFDHNIRKLIAFNEEPRHHVAEAPRRQAAKMKYTMNIPENNREKLTQNQQLYSQFSTQPSENMYPSDYENQDILHASHSAPPPTPEDVLSPSPSSAPIVNVTSTLHLPPMHMEESLDKKVGHGSSQGKFALLPADYEAQETLRVSHNAPSSTLEDRSLSASPLSSPTIKITPKLHPPPVQVEEKSVQNTEQDNFSITPDHNQRKARNAKSDLQIMLQEIIKRRESKSDHVFGHKHHQQYAPVVVEKNIGDSAEASMHVPTFSSGQQKSAKPNDRKLHNAKTLITEQQRFTSNNHKHVELHNIDLIASEYTERIETSTTSSTNDFSGTNDGEKNLRPFCSKYPGLKCFLKRTIECGVHVHHDGNREHGTNQSPQ